MITGTSPDERPETYTCPVCWQEHRHCDEPCWPPTLEQVFKVTNMLDEQEKRISALEKLIVEMGMRLTDHECRHETTRRAKLWSERVEEMREKTGLR